MTPLIENFMNIGITTQPAATDVEDELAYIGPDPGGTERPDNLINRLIAGGTDTRSIAKGTCAAVLGSAAVLMQ